MANVLKSNYGKMSYRWFHNDAHKSPVVWEQSEYYTVDYALYTLQIKGLYRTATLAKMIWGDVKDNIKHPAATTILVSEIWPVELAYLPIYHASKIVLNLACDSCGHYLSSYRMWV